jgi:hypothetical protein
MGADAESKIAREDWATRLRSLESPRTDLALTVRYVPTGLAANGVFPGTLDLRRLLVVSALK